MSYLRLSSRLSNPTPHSTPFRILPISFYTSESIPPPSREWSSPSSRPNPIKSALAYLKSPKTVTDSQSIEEPDTTPSPSTPSSSSTSTSIPSDALAHRAAMKRTFPEGWAPPRKISREAMEGLRTLHNHDPEMFSTPVLAARFKISPEAVRRILKSKWAPDSKRLAQMAAKEARAHVMMVEEKKERARAQRTQKATSAGPIEMYMDEESDAAFTTHGGVVEDDTEGSRRTLSPRSRIKPKRMPKLLPVELFMDERRNNLSPHMEEERSQGDLQSHSTLSAQSHERTSKDSKVKFHDTSFLKSPLTFVEAP